MTKPTCAIVGIGPKNGAAFARRFHEGGYRLALLSRTTELSLRLVAELGDAKAGLPPLSWTPRLARVCAWRDSRRDGSEEGSRTSLGPTR